MLLFGQNGEFTFEENYTMKNLTQFASLIAVLALITNVISQQNFDFEVALKPLEIQGVSGMQSYAWGQSEGKWLIVGGRLDGVHARQPFNAFPANKNNASLWVIDPIAKQVWSAPLSSLPTSIAEQLQSTNMNFYQDADTLYLLGGYAFSPTANDHITFDKLTSVRVSSVINAIINNESIVGYFKQIADPFFANTGGQMGKIDDTFFLIGGHKFYGRYNPMNNPTFTQTYQTKIQKFKINNIGSQLSISDYEQIADPVHLRRRDYNLISMIYPDGEFGYMISSGVFQMSTDMPFLYPVEIREDGYEPITTFNQYLSHYHSAKVALYDDVTNDMHAIFFGGISQYYYENGQLIQDDLVPFVKTISRVTRAADGTYTEFKLPIEMPGLKGAGAEFIPSATAPILYDEIVDLNALSADTTIIGYIFGGIHSNQLNPFDNNQTNTTNADASIFEVQLIRKQGSTSDIQMIDGKNPFSMTVYPIPFKDKFTVEMDLTGAKEVRYFINSMDGKIIQKGWFDNLDSGVNRLGIRLTERVAPQNLQLIIVVDGKYFLTEQIQKK